MKCQNCGKNEVNFRYTQIVNGVKKEMALCNKCARELGLEDMDFSMPINFSSFFSDFFHEAEEFLPSFTTTNLLQCNKCGTTFENFVNDGEFGCSNCYITFADRISPVLKNLHGANIHIGRGYKESIDELEYNRNEFEKRNSNKEVKSKDNSSNEKNKEDQVKELQKDLQKAIKEERYEDAAKIRDEIKKLEEK